jgi:hypothetical protein
MSNLQTLGRGQRKGAGWSQQSEKMNHLIQLQIQPLRRRRPNAILFL